MTTYAAPPADAHAPAGSQHAPSAAAASLLARLDDPATAAALHDLLDHVELIALAATMADGLLRRSETITDNLVSGLAEVRTAADAATDGLDLRATLTRLSGLLPALKALSASRLLRPETLGALDTMSGALVTGLDAARTSPRRTFFRSLLAEVRDPETARGLSALLGVARALGRGLDR